MTNLRGGPAWPPVRHPFEVAAMIVFWLIGLFGLIGQGSHAMSELLPPLGLLVWQIGLLVATFAGAMSAAIATREAITSLLLERIFLAGLAAFSGVFAVALSQSGSTLFTAVFTIYAGASAARLWQVQRYLRWRRTATEVLQSSVV